MNIRPVARLASAPLKTKLVRVVGVEPTLLAEPDFESGASTNSTTPAESWQSAFKPPEGCRRCCVALAIGMARNGCPRLES